MSVNLLRSVSVIAISTSLAMPAPILAQAQTETPAAETCPDGAQPVTDAAGQAVCPPSAEAGAEAEAEADPAQAEGDANATAAPDAADAAPAEQAESEAPTPPPAAEAEGQGAAEADTSAEAGAAPEEAGAAPETEAEAGGNAAAEAEVEAEAAAPEEETAPNAEGTAATEATEAPATDDPAPESEAATAQPEPETAPVESTTTEAEASDAPNAPASDAETEAARKAISQNTEQPADQATPEAEGTAATTAESAPEEPTTEEPATTAEGDPAATQETPTQDTAGTEGEAESAPDATAESQAPDATEEAQAAQEPVDVEVSQDDTAESTAEANQTVAAEAAADESVAIEESEADNVVTVTEETARSSSEEFATTAAAPADDDDGMSNFEKFALGALGVAAAATYLNNRNEDVVVSSQDRLVVQDAEGNYRVLKDDDELLRRPGVQVATKEFSDGSTRSVVTRENGVRVVTIRAPDGQVLKRTRILPDGREIVLFDDTVDVEPVQMSFLEQYQPQERMRDVTGEDELRAALMSVENPTDRRFSLQQVRQIRAVRELVPEIDVDDVNFESGSAVIRAEEAQDLSEIGNAIAAAIEENPDEVFMIEGHTDAVGGAAMNLALSDRRAESAALALTEYFDIPPENLVVQGYGESNLKIRTNEAERENRRVAVRRITPLLYSQR